MQLMELGLTDAMVGWVVLALLFAVLEVFTVGFFWCFFAIGALVAALSSLVVSGLLPQSIIFVIASLGLVVMARPLLKTTFKVGDKPSVDSNVSALLNTSARVLEPVDRYTGKVKASHTGEVWSAYLANPSDETIPANAEAIIVKVDGAKLAVQLATGNS